MLRNPSRLNITSWRGLNTFEHKEEVEPDFWVESNNVLVNSRGHAEALRSPKTFKADITEFTSSSESSSSEDNTGLIHGLEHYDHAIGAHNGLVIDKGDDTLFLECADGVAGFIRNLRSAQSGNPFSSLLMTKPSWLGFTAKLNTLMRCDTEEFIQYVYPLAAFCFDVGISPPAAAPTVAIVSATSNPGTLDVGVQVSFSYVNTATGHVSFPSPVSARTATGGPDQGVKIDWTPSTQHGVDKVVFFITVDGGNVPYNYLFVLGQNYIGGAEFDGTPFTVDNGTGTTTVRLDHIGFLDTLTPEPIYNNPPPTNATFMFQWKDRVFLVVNGKLRYSGYESCYIGQPTESYPPLNELACPNAEDSFVGGISTQLGALIFGFKDSYLLSGYPSDKTAGPQNVNAVSEHVEPMDWKIGIYDPKTAVKTPFGIIWTDQTRRIRLWTLNGYPQEIAEPLRKELSSMSGTFRARWLQRGEAGGQYILTNETKTLIVSIFNDKGQTQFGYGKSDTPTGPIAVGRFRHDSSDGEGLLDDEQFMFANGDNIFEWLDPDLEGDGWPANTDLSFAIILGSDQNFTHLHSMQLTGETDGLDVKVAPFDNSEQNPVVLEADLDTGNSKYGIIDAEGRRHRVNFVFSPDDSYQTVDTVTFFSKNKKRLI